MTDPDNIPIDNISITDIRNGLKQAVTREDQADTRLWLKRWQTLNLEEDCQTSLGSHTNALHITARQGNADIARDLLKYGFDVNAVAMGSMPLHLAVKNGNEAVMRLLVDQDADLNSHDEQNGFTALHLAAQNGFRSAAKFLLENGANVNALDKSKDTPLHMAASSSNEEVAASLLAHSDITASPYNVNGRTPLHIAALHGHERIVSMLLQHGVYVDIRDSASGSTALCFAAEMGKNDVVRLLIQSGAQVNLRKTSKELWTALHVGVSHGHLRVVQELLEGKPDPDIRDVQGHTALHVAVLASNIEIASTLIDRGFDVNAHTNNLYKSVPLAMALLYRAKPMVKLILENNANFNITGPVGDTVLHGLAALPECLDLLELVLEYNPDVNAVDRNKVSPLMIAASTGNTQIAEKLLEKQANVQMKNMNYETALHIAAHGGHLDVVRALLKYGAIVDAEDQKKRTPLHYVSIVGNLEVALLLVNAGAKIGARDIVWQTPLWYAQDNGFTRLVELFEAHIGLTPDKLKCSKF
jgi:ankyrin